MNATRRPSIQLIEPGSQKVVGEIDAETNLVLDGDLLTGLEEKGGLKAVRAELGIGPGTLIHFRPHRPWFEPEMAWPQPEQSVPWDFNRLATRLEQVAHLHPGVRIELRDERGSQKDHRKRIFHSQNGLLDYVAALTEGLKPLHKPIRFKGDSVDGAISLKHHYQS